MSNYGFDERDTTTAVTRESMHQPQPPLPPQQAQQAPPNYGYAQPPGYGARAPYGFGRGLGFGHRGPSETKPFFLTSEFVMSVVAAIAIAISAATMHAFGGWRAWILIAAIVCSYNLSRGIAKAGTRSRAHDPREDVDLHFGRGHDERQHHSA
jgi:hypothetical protein